MGKSSKGNRKRFSFIKVVLVVINIIAAIGLIAAYISPYVSPENNSLLPFFGLSYTIFLIINVIFVFIWLLIKKIWCLFSLILIIVGWQHIFTHFQYTSDRTFTESDTLIRIMSYNVKNFGIYDYSEGWKHNFGKRDKIFSFIKEQSPDVICFQEFVHDVTGKFKTLDTLIKFQKAINYHVEYSVNSRSQNYFGLAIFSSLPIINKGLIDFSNSTTNMCIYTDVILENDTIRIYNAHFESIHFSSKEYDYATKTPGISEVKSHKLSFTRIFSLMKAAYIDRAEQVETVSEHIAKCPYKVVLCTDLNDTPVSYAYQVLKSLLKDSFVENGNGLGNTYNGEFPSFRIDYIFHSETIESANYQTYEVDFSDHYPVICDIIIKKH